MSESRDEQFLRKPLSRLWKILRLEKEEIGAIYFYAILAGLIQLTIPLGIQAIINFVLAGSLSTSMVVLIIMVVSGVFIDGFLQVKQMNLIERVQQKVFVRYSFLFAARIPRLDMSKIDNYYLPELINRFFDTVVFQKSISKILLDVPTALIQLLFGLILLSLYANLFIVFSLLVVLILIIIIRLTASQGLKTSLEESNYKYGVAAWLQELARVFKTFHFAPGSNLPLKKTDELTHAYVISRTGHFKILLFQYWTFICFKVLITAGMLVLGGLLLVNNEINVGQFVAAEIVILSVIAAIEKLIKSLDKVYDLLTSVEKLGKVMDKPKEISGTLALPSQPVKLTFKNVSFAYNGEAPVLSGVNFEIANGQVLGIAGKDGSGKSTLARLVTGAYKDFTGQIEVDGIPILNYDLESYRDNMGIMFHDQDVFDGSLGENIFLERNYDKNRIGQLIEAFGFNSFFEAFPNGLDEQLMPSGKRMPVSLVRKILLLRAFVHQPGLMILEEPWHKQDEPSAEKIKEYLLKSNKATTLVLTNDPHFLSQCDQVLYL